MNAGLLWAVSSAAGGGGNSDPLIPPLAYLVLKVCLILLGLGVLMIVVLELLDYIIRPYGGMCGFLAAGGRWLWRHRVRIFLGGVLACTVGGIGAAAWATQPARHRDYWNVPNREPIPEPLKEAGRLDAAIARDDAALQAEMDKITALIDAARPDQFNLYKEVVTTEALRGYVEKLLRLGESAVAGMGRMKKTARELDPLLKEAPARFREMALLERRYAENEPYADLKGQYLILADVFEAKAKAAEGQRGDVQKNLNGDLENYLTGLWRKPSVIQDTSEQ